MSEKKHKINRLSHAKACDYLAQLFEVMHQCSH